MKKTPVTGSCLCGKVSYSLVGDIGIFQYCHCSRCRKFTGSAHASNLFTRPDEFTWISGKEFVQQYEPDNTKYFATAFCKVCGSSLPWFSKGGKTVVIPAGTLDDDPVTRPQWNIFCASKAEWYVDSADLPYHDKLPPRVQK